MHADTYRYTVRFVELWTKPHDHGLSPPSSATTAAKIYLRCGMCHRSSAQSEARSSTVWVSTRVPAASCAGSEYSAGLWLMPLRHGTKIMPVGHTGTTNCASWNAPEGRRM